ANISYAVSASDHVDGAVTVTCDKASGTLFQVGETTVTCSATDSHRNTSTGSFQVKVVDTIPPTIAAHGDVTAEATSASGAIVTYANPATSDIVDGPGTASCAPASGVGFALGSTTVICGASDKAGNAAAATSFKVTVQDTTAPVVTAPAPVTAKATGPLTSVNIGTATATDAVGVVSLTNDAPATFPVGSTLVTWTAKDAAGNIGTAKQTLSVEYNWAGFFSPINNDVVNKVKAGSAIPVKFSLGGNMGLDVFAAGYPISVIATNFDGVIAVNDITDLATVTAGGSSLTYDPLANQYIYVWKTDKTWAGTSRQLQVRMKDGIVHVANFTFAK
ncbi:MAG TPA: PxKF domain-containing protein, partial [Geobacteraceae bacterium]